MQALSAVSQAHAQFFTQFNGAIHTFDVVPKVGGGGGHFDRTC